MTNTTEVYWEADGTSLHTHARNITTRGHGLTKPAPFRGEDITIPYRVGQVYQPKTPDSRLLTLDMWVKGTDDNGVIPATATLKRAQYDQNLSQLIKLLWVQNRQVALRKRFYESNVLRSATALCEYQNGFDASMIGRTASKFTVDMKLQDPYFYDDELKSFTLVNGDNTIVVPGHANTSNILINISGARVNPIIWNKTLGMQVEYHAALTAGALNVLDIANFKSTTTPSGVAAFDSEVLVRHVGAPMWLALAPGTNIINLSSTSGAGTVILQARGAWF